MLQYRVGNKSLGSVQPSVSSLQHYASMKHIVNSVLLYARPGKELIKGRSTLTHTGVLLKMLNLK